MSSVPGCPDAHVLFASSFERVYLGGEVAGRALDIGAGGLLGRDAPAERFDLQESVSAAGSAIPSSL